MASRFNDEIVDGLLLGARRAVEKCGGDWGSVVVYRVPGAFEIPLAAQKAIATGKFDAVIALGCLIKGDTPHFEYISQQASLGIGKVALDTGVPVGFGVITVLSDEQALQRSGDNDGNKGFEAAIAAIEMVDLMRLM